MSKSKWYCLGLVFSSLLGYLEWGNNQHVVLWQAEWDILSTLAVNPMQVIHPLTIIPLIGQLLLIICMLQHSPNKWLIWTGMGAIASLLVLMFAIGLLGLRWRIVGSTLPFIITASLTTRYLLKKD
ncbi:MAG: hypothetical protein MUE96_11320 [Bacteroidia bacterium]|nr:hypothetical protein [Bacteroidia bacterium]